MKATLRVPTTQFGYIEVEYTEFPDNNVKYLVDMFKEINSLWNSPQDKSKKPTFLGQTMVENGHVYKAVQNEKTKEFYWLINKV